MFELRTFLTIAGLFSAAQSVALDFDAEDVCKRLTSYAAEATPSTPDTNAFYSFATAHVDCDRRIYTVVAQIRPAAVESLPRMKLVLHKAICAHPGWTVLFDEGWTVQLDLQENNVSATPMVSFKSC